MIVKKIQEFALKTYWVNSKINYGKRLYFNNLFMPRFIDSLNDYFDISVYYDLKYAFNQSPVKGLINSIFDPNEKYFNVLDLSVAINIAINGYCNEKDVNNLKIVDSANYICEMLKNQLYDDKILKDYLSDIDRKIQDFNFQVDRANIDTILKDKQSIFKSYFLRYHKDDYSTRIKIYHQAKNKSWIDWSCKNTITINHNLIRFRKGFFLVGFDYRLLTGEHLKIASVENGYEYFNPKKYKWGENVVWAY